MLFHIKTHLYGGNMKRYKVTLTEEERSELDKIRSKGNHKSQKVLNSLILLNADEGKFQIKYAQNETIAKGLNISERKIARVKKRFVEESLEVALNGRRGTRIYEKKIDGDLEAHLIAISCGSPPEGFSRWSLRMLADKVVELEYVDAISHETIRRVLKKTSLNHGKRKGG